MTPVMRAILEDALRDWLEADCLEAADVIGTNERDRDVVLEAMTQAAAAAFDVIVAQQTAEGTPWRRG